MDANERKALGEETHRKVFSYNHAPKENGLLWEKARDLLFAEIWSREVLSIRDRRLAILGAIVALGEPGAFEVHCKSALKNGEVTPDEMQELLLILTYYCGYPRISRVATAFAALMKENAPSPNPTDAEGND